MADAKIMGLATLITLAGLFGISIVFFNVSYAGMTATVAITNISEPAPGTYHVDLSYTIRNDNDFTVELRSGGTVQIYDATGETLLSELELPDFRLASGEEHTAGIGVDIMLPLGEIPDQIHVKIHFQYIWNSEVYTYDLDQVVSIAEWMAVYGPI